MTASTTAAAPPDDAERRARAALTRLAEPGDQALVALVDAHGAQEVVERLRSGEPLGQDSRGWRVRLEGYDPDSDLDAGARVGARLICPGDDEWPPLLDDLQGVMSLDRRTGSGRDLTAVPRGGAPLALWARGEGVLAELCTQAVALVGARAATPYGTETAGEIAYDVSGRGVTVVSGAAYGIDGAAHRGALAAGARTLAVLACGVDVSYPRGHAALLERVTGAGLVLSEVPPGSAPSRIRFLVRNRVIAALSAGTVVVEAAVRSGALNTARWAQQMMRPVMGVPGPVTSGASAGVHELLRDGMSVLVTDGGEVLEAISSIGDNLLPRRYAAARPRDRLDELSQRVLEAVPAVHHVGVERIARTAGLPVQEIEVKLGRLLLQDFVERRGNLWRLSQAARADAGAGPG
ncbi:MAG: DNA-processing protein DprA [Nocardioidaceae bacterium]